MSIKSSFLAVLVVLCLQNPAAGAPRADFIGHYSSQEFNNYWYTRGAEISRFALQQARYGEIHSGNAVLVFVTEPMNPDLQVKADSPRRRNIPMLKLNAVRKFKTGIYPYSVMTSIFSAIDFRHRALPLKISFTSQEWCGNIFMQMNLRQGGYRIQQHSYFEKEADRNFHLPKIISEDAIWTQIRLSPQTLPQGNFRMIPGMLYTRLLHHSIEPQPVTATLKKVSQKGSKAKPLAVYTVRYLAEGRVLAIFFDSEFPYRIERWQETYKGLPNMGAKKLTTRAVRTHTLMIDYWNRHANPDRHLRRKLGLADD